MTGIDPQLVAALSIEEGTIIAGKYRVDSLLAAGAACSAQAAHAGVEAIKAADQLTAGEAARESERTE